MSFIFLPKYTAAKFGKNSSDTYDDKHFICTFKLF